MTIKTLNKLRVFADNANKQLPHPCDYKRWYDFVWESYHDDSFDIISDMEDLKQWFRDENFTETVFDSLCSHMEDNFHLLNYLFETKKIS